MSSIHINKKQFQNYLDCSYPTALKQYDLYLMLSNKHKGLTLTAYDISRIDDVPLDVIEKRVNGIG